MNIALFLQEHTYIDYSSPVIARQAEQLFNEKQSPTEKAITAYEFVRDEIPHSFDINASVVTSKASEVLIHRTGICHAKANLLAALLRAANIPTGFCFQHITLLDDDRKGYCVHCFNAILLDGTWVKVDARGNTKGKNAQFSLQQPMLAFANRKEFNEFFWKGIFANPHPATMNILDRAASLQDVLDTIPDQVNEIPEIQEA